MSIPAVNAHLPLTGPTTSDATAKAGAPTAQDAKKIEDSARQFEAMMVRQVLSETFKPSPAAKGQAMPGADIYQSFMTDTVADNITKNGSLGISHLLQSQLTPAKISRSSSRHSAV